MFETVKLDINDNIGIVTLNRPDKLNAFNPQMGKDLYAAFNQLDANTDVRAILLRGEGKAFCVGGDIEYFATKLEDMPADIPDVMEILNALILLMRTMSKPILAEVQGAAAGVGISFLCASDFVLAANSAQFNLAYATNIGLSPDGGASFLLPRMIGQRKALEMMMMPKMLSAEEALTLNLINEVVADAELDQRSSKLMYKLANGPSVMYGKVKKLLHSSWENSLEDQLMAEMQAFTECTVTEDFSNGIKGFLSKSKVVFTGK